MLDMLRIGGCIVFSCTLLSLIQPFAARESLFAVFSGLIEVSTGTSTIAALALPLRLRVSLLTSAAAFGAKCRPQAITAFLQPSSERMSWSASNFPAPNQILTCWE